MAEVKVRKKILFFSHAVTMAHFTRPMQWIEALEQNQYDIYFACPLAFKKWIRIENLKWINLECIATAAFADSVNQAGLIYDLATFEKHIEEDIILMNQVQPDLVIGDFRHSLSVSCRRLKIRYINMTNAYWSPHIKMHYPLPEAPIIRKLGERLSRVLLTPFTPFVLKFNFFKMVYILRRPLKSVGLRFNDYRQIITDGDETIYFDTPDLVPIKRQSKNEKFMGPLVWSMPVELPKWWKQLNPQKIRIFIALGSSGNQEVLPLLIKSIAQLDVEIIVALSEKKWNCLFFQMSLQLTFCRLTKLAEILAW